MAETKVTGNEIQDTNTGAWLTWAPTLTGLSGGTLNYAKYMRVGKTIFWRFKYTLAGAGVSTDPKFTLPVAPHADYAASDSFLTYGQINDATGVRYLPAIILSSGSTVLIAYYNGTPAMGTITSTAPITFASGDQFILSGSYEAA